MTASVHPQASAASASSTAPAASASSAPEVAEPRARFRDLLAAEWLKLWSLRSTPWSLLLTGLAVLAFNAGAAWDHYRYWHQLDESSRREFVSSGMPLVDAFTSNGATVLALAAGSMGALAISCEYGTGLIRTTFAAVPARRSVLAAKACVVAVVMTAFGAVLAVVSFLATQAILDARGAGVGFGHPQAGRLLLASALLAPVCALTGLAVGALVRHSAGAVVGVLLLLLVLPLVALDQRYWTALIDHALPLSAWNRLADVMTGSRAAADFPWTVTGAWTVYAVWALVAGAVAVTAVHRRDQ